MTLHDYLTILRRSWPVILIATIVGTLIALGLSLAMTPVYQATSQLFVSVKSAGAAGDAYTGGLFVQQRVKSYVDVVDSPPSWNRSSRNSVSTAPTSALPRRSRPRHPRTRSF